MIYIIYSSLSVWVKNCDNLELSDNDREKLDEYIDDLYKRIDEADRVYDEDGMEMGKHAISQHSHDMQYYTSYFLVDMYEVSELTITECKELSSES